MSLTSFILDPFFKFFPGSRYYTSVEINDNIEANNAVIDHDGNTIPSCPYLPSIAVETLLLHIFPANVGSWVKITEILVIQNSPTFDGNLGIPCDFQKQIVGLSRGLFREQAKLVNRKVEPYHQSNEG